jgi:sugar lactone lactonase YvrE
MSRAVDLVVSGLGFPECPRWYEGHLLVSDMMTKKLHRISESGEMSVVAEFPHRPSGMGVLPDGSLVVASMFDCRILRLDGDGFSEVADLSALTPGLLNDIVVDGSGRVYVGDTIGDRNDDGTVTPAPGPPSTNIITFTVGAPPRIVARGLGITNTMVVTPDERTLIVAETAARKLTAFTIDDDGSLSGRRLFADLPDEVPNGIALDAEGAVWVSSHSGRYLRVIEGGRVAETIDVPGNPDCIAIACIHGGADRRQLFLLSCEFPNGRRMPTLQDWLDNVLRTGRVDVTTVDVPGAGWP